ncbi:MAG: type II toxin-antitoxin system RelE/ParE family toxin [Syntrophobacteraceae bacterium]
MRVFKTKWFSRFARKEEISDQRLIDAVREIEKGLPDADLGSGLIKKRIARAGQGKRSGYRTIIVYRAGDRAVFLYGFSKSAKANLSAVELEAYQKLARIYLSFTPAGIGKALGEGELEEVDYNVEEIQE